MKIIKINGLNLLAQVEAATTAAFNAAAVTVAAIRSEVSDLTDAAVTAATSALASASAAEASADLARDISNIEVPDNVVAALVADSGSDSRAQIDARVATGADARIDLALAAEVAMASRVGVTKPSVRSVTNLLSNPALAVDATGWFTSGYGTGGAGTAARVAGAGPKGDAAWVTTWSSAPSGGAANFGPYNDRSPVTPGEIRSGSIWVHCTQSVTLSHVIAWFTAATGGSPIAFDQSQVTIPGNTWTLLTSNPAFVAPATATHVGEYIRSNNLSDMGTATLTIARATLTEGRALKPFGIGTLSNWATSGIGAAWGDSMTQTAHGGGSTFPEHLRAQLGMDFVYNGGRGGEAALGVAIRQGGAQPLVTFPSNQIPASGAATVTVSPSSYFRNDGAWNFQGSIGGIEGTLTRATSTGVWTFTRLIAGSVVNLLPGGTPFRARTTQDYADFATIWAGANDIDAGTTAGVLAAVAAMAERCNSAGQPFVVLSVLNPDYAPEGNVKHTFVVTVNEALAQRYGNRFLDVRRYLIDHGLAVAGITPTAGDTTAISEDRIPPSLMHDSIHLNDAGRLVVAKYVAQYLAAYALV